MTAPGHGGGDAEEVQAYSCSAETPEAGRSEAFHRGGTSVTTKQGKVIGTEHLHEASGEGLDLDRDAMPDDDEVRAGNILLVPKPERRYGTRAALRRFGQMTTIYKTISRIRRKRRRPLARF